MKQLDQTAPGNNEWADTAKDSFEFELLAAQRFESGETDDKRPFLDSRLETDLTR